MSDFYEAFLTELGKVTVKADAPAVNVVGACIRAAKRAQMVMDGEAVSPGPWTIDGSTPSEVEQVADHLGIAPERLYWLVEGDDPDREDRP